MNLKNLISPIELEKQAHKKIKKIFFHKICGAGMGPAAVLLKEAGFDVEGADTNFYPPMSTFLETTGIKTFQLSEVNLNFLQKYDLIIVGNSLSGKSEMARMIEECGVYFTSFPQALGTLILKNKNVIGVAGTHGKTTTTYFLTQLLDKLEQNPGYLIGGIMEGKKPATLGENYFVIEADEYDSAYFHKLSKFRLYEVNNMILTSLEFDHADIFSSLEKIEEEFIAVLPQVTGAMIANEDYASIKKIKKMKNPRCEWIDYGVSSSNGPCHIKTFSSQTQFEVMVEGEYRQFLTNITGNHNILNLTSCILFLVSEGFSLSQIQEAVKSLEMVKRRQEERGVYRGMIVIDDFAHHPRAIEVTIEAIKTKYPGKKIITIFEPISATARSDVFQKEFANALSFSDKVIIAQSPIPTTAIGKKDLNIDLLLQEIKSESGAIKVTSINELRENIDAFVNPNNLLLVLSNRTCLGLWESSFVSELNH